nr:cory-CC-star protein [Neisseria sp. HSC-16F19]
MHEFYHAPYRQTLTRAYRDERDLFMLMIFAESLGIPNPMTFYTLELQPLLMEEFHDWHLRMNIPQSPLERFGCC